MILRLLMEEQTDLIQGFSVGFFHKAIPIWWTRVPIKHFESDDTE